MGYHSTIDDMSDKPRTLREKIAAGSKHKRGADARALRGGDQAAPGGVPAPATAPEPSGGDPGQQSGTGGQTVGGAPMIQVGARVIPRPHAKNIAESLQKHLEGVFSEEQIAEAYRDLLQADRVYMDRNGNTIRTPDFAIRLATLKDYMDRTLGRAIERQQIVTHQAPASLDDLLERAAKSPVFRETLMGLLQRLASVPQAGAPSVTQA